MSLDEVKSILGMGGFSNLEVITIITLSTVVILLMFFQPVFKTRLERQKCQDYAELINVEYAYKKNLGCFIQKENKWKLVDFENLEAEYDKKDRNYMAPSRSL